MKLKENSIEFKDNVIIINESRLRNYSCVIVKVKNEKGEISHVKEINFNN